MAGIGFRTVAEVPHLPVGTSGRFSVRLFRAVGLSFLVVLPRFRLIALGPSQPIALAGHLDHLGVLQQAVQDRRGAVKTG